MEGKVENGKGKLLAGWMLLVMARFLDVLAMLAGWMLLAMVRKGTIDNFL